MKLIIDVPEEIVKKGFEGPLTDEERMVIIRAVGNAIPYKENSSKEDVFTRKEELSKEESEWLIDFITEEGGAG